MGSFSGYRQSGKQLSLCYGGELAVYVKYWNRTRICLAAFCCARSLSTIGETHGYCQFPTVIRS